MKHGFANCFVIVINSYTVLRINEFCSVTVKNRTGTGNFAVFINMLINKI